MKMTRFPWEAMIVFVVGVALGLLYAWVLAPIEVVDAVPSALRADFKDQYRAVIAAAYAADGDLVRAQSRLDLLGDTDPYAALSAQAQRVLSNGDTLESYQLAQLASALHGESPTALPATPTVYVVEAFTAEAVILVPTITPMDTTVPVINTNEPLPFYTATPRPTATLIPTPSAPFVLAVQETICDESLREGLLQVITQTSNRRQIPGVELILSWAGGEEHFFTGFKPELGNGYADAVMSSGVMYSLRAAGGGALVAGLTPPSCQKANGETYTGGLKITLQRP